MLSPTQFGEPAVVAIPAEFAPDAGRAAAVAVLGQRRQVLLRRPSGGGGNLLPVPAAHDVVATRLYGGDAISDLVGCTYSALSSSDGL